MDHFTPFADKAPPEIVISDTPLWSHRAVAIVFAAAFMSLGWVGHGVTDALIDLDRHIASSDRR